jgi:voltage-gated potassium channel
MGRSIGVSGDPWARFRFGIALLLLVLVTGTVGYTLLGLSALDAVYQTVITVSTVGFREVTPDGELSTGYKLFTIALVLFGAGTVLYTLSLLLETLLEGRLSDTIWRRRMQNRIDELSDHVIVCGWGQVGQAIGAYVKRTGNEVVVIDKSDERLSDAEGHLVVVGDATQDDILIAAGIERAATLISALDHDSDNLFVTVSARSLRPDLQIVSRALGRSTEEKLRRAGASRVVNPHELGGSRMAALALHQYVAEFLDVMVHDQDWSTRLEQVKVTDESPFAGRSLAECDIRSKTGAMVVSVRDAGGVFHTNPPADRLVEPGEVIIAMGTGEQLNALARAAQ